MVPCAVCGLATDGNLCGNCATELDNPLPFVAEQVLSAAAKPGRAMLIDAWGRLHRLEAVTSIGRTPRARGLSLFHASVSRQHAEIVAQADQWIVRDLESSNGTKVNDENVTTRTLAPADRISFGAVGFYFVLDDGKRTSPHPSLGSRTLRPEEGQIERIPAASGDTTTAGIPRMGFKLLELPAGGGGYLEAAGQRLHLSGPQLEMLQMLADRMLTQDDVSPLVRGFVPTGQLIADLSWDSSEPDENNLKQLVRRIRRALETIRLGGLIESRRGFGYRLRVIPVEPMSHRE